jgi:DNA polymerase-3 subunit beta
MVEPSNLLLWFGCVQWHLIFSLRFFLEAMKFTIVLADFQKLLQTVIQAVPPKSTLPVLENVHAVVSGSTLQVTATDQELTIISTADVESVGEGEILMPARRLLDLIKALGSTGKVSVSTDDKTLKITLKTDGGEYVLHGLSAREFPDIPDFSDGASLHLAAADAMTIARTASFAASKDEYRPSMTGMLLRGDAKSLAAVTTDGFRLVRVLIHAGEQPLARPSVDVIIPVRAIDLLKKVDNDLDMLVNRTHARFSLGRTVVITRIIDEVFPPYEGVIPKDNDKVARFLISDLMASVKRVSLFANPNTKQIRFQLAKNSLTTVADDVETGNRGQEGISCDYDAESFEIGFNYRYIEDALSHLSDTGASEAVATFSTPSRAVLIKPLRDEQESDDVLMLVMPVRL